MLKINDNLSIKDEEIRFTYSRSPGPGGQNVNKTATKVTLWFDVSGSASLSADQRRRLCAALSTRIGRDGRLRVSGWRHRTQSANRREVLARFVVLLASAMRPKRPRRATRPSRAARERRLREKRLRGRQKEARSWRPSRDEG